MFSRFFESRTGEAFTLLVIMIVRGKVEVLRIGERVLPAKRWCTRKSREPLRLEGPRLPGHRAQYLIHINKIFNYSVICYALE